MAIFVFILALILAIGGGGALVASVDLMPTEVGLLYAGCGVIALSSACVVASIGALLIRIERVGTRFGNALFADEAHLGHFAEAHAAHPAPAAPAPQPPLVAPRAAEPPKAEPPKAPPRAAERSTAEDPVNENRSGHLPTLEEIEETFAHPEPPPRLIGRYSAGGANYAIFSDGSVEAEMTEGQFNFASMGDFRAFLEDRRAQQLG